MAPYDTRPVTQAILDGGFAWEEEVISRCLAERVDIAAAEPGIKLRDRIFSSADTEAAISGLQPGRYLYQPTLSVPGGFYERYGIDPKLVFFADCRPDLIKCVQVGDQLELRVIDVKASPGVKLSHRIQATLYTMILRDCLTNWEMPGRVTSDVAGIWLAQAEAEEEFEIRMMRPPLETFLTHELQALLSQPAADARWHLYFRCEWCEYFQHCRSEMRRTDDVSRVPYLSAHAKRYLADLDPSVRTVSDLSSLVADKDKWWMLADCASLSGQESHLYEQTRALQEEAVVPHRGSSLALPVGENVRILLTLQSEPVSGQVYAYGFHAQGLRGIQGDNPPPVVRVARRPSPEVVEGLERQLVRDLFALLSPVDVFNRDHRDEWTAQKTLQTYVFDTYERELLTAVLMRRLLDPEVSEEALQLFFYFQRPELIRAEDHPATEVFFPVVVLVQVLRTLLALPSEVSYRFADVVQTLKPRERSFDYRRSDYFGFELSNQMRSDAIFNVWYHERDELVDSIEGEINRRLWATGSALNGMREYLKDSGDPLFAWPPKFQLPEAQGFNHPILSRLAFVARYESVVQYLDTRQSRMKPQAERLRDGEALIIASVGGSRFILDDAQRDVEIDSSDFPNWLVTADDEEGRRAMLAFDDFFWRDKMFVPRRSKVAFAAVTRVGPPELSQITLDLDVKRGESSPEIVNGRRYLLQNRYTDFNSRRTIGELREIDNDPDAPFLQLITQPAQSATPAAVDTPLRDTALNLGRQHGMTASQHHAFEGIVDRQLQLVWGPPGTGKTHFLSLAVLSLAEAHRRAGLALRVMITAFTHAAIDNCLAKIVALQTELKVYSGELPIGKLGRGLKASTGGVAAIEDRSAGSWLATHAICVAGATTWAMRKDCEPGVVDLLVIDEASQLKVPESAIAVRRLRSGGRLLIAGDDKQLPPIVQGVYPDPEDEEPLLHRSIFECLREQDPDTSFTSILLENFRMNATLCRYPAQQIYVDEYRSVNEAIAGRNLTLGPTSGPRSLVDELTDPEWPLVVAVLTGVRAAAENRVEADLVAQVAISLRERLLRDGRLYAPTPAGDREFWSDGLFIVSPHHAQIHAIQRALKARRDWTSTPFVDTVDKMQGQECDTVIASYGVSDVEYAMNESEFIYSLNRLNVSITRARSKTIVFLAQPLIEPPIQAFEDDRSAAGIAFMQGLVQFAEREGSMSTYELEAGASLRVLRVPAT